MVCRNQKSYQGEEDVQSKVREEHGSPARWKHIKAWHARFKGTGFISAPRVRERTVNHELIIQSYEESPKHFLRRVSNNLGVSVSSVRRALKFSGFKPYHPQIVQKLKAEDQTARISFAEFILQKIAVDPNFLRKIIFSDEALFHLEGGINKHNLTHWSRSNPHWRIEKSLNSPKVMVWAALGATGIIGPLFIEGNVDADQYLRLLEEEFYPAFYALGNASELFFMQDGAPPHWALRVREWLNENFSNRWIGRGGPRDSNISWPPRSPDLTPMDFFVWGFVKEKVYVKNYENLADLKESILAAFLELTNEMISSSVKNIQKRLKLVVERRGLHVEN